MPGPGWRWTPCWCGAEGAGPTAAPPASGTAAEAEEEEGGPPTELRLIPDDPSAVERLFAAMCEAAALNPDGGSCDDGEGAGDFFYDRDGLPPDLAADLQARAARLDALVIDDAVGGDDDDGRFDDPDEEEGEGEEGEGEG